MGDRRRAAARRPARDIAAPAVAVVLAALLACGCAAIPSSGTPQSAAIPPPAGGGIPQGYGLVLQPPQPGWSTTQVVNNFLLASSNAADNYRLARQYLTAQASRSWHPGPGVTILSGTPQVIVKPPGLTGGPVGERQVQANGQKLATLTSSGQYIPAPSGAKAPPEVFSLQQNKRGVYQISALPTAGTGAGSGLLLTSDLFHLVYTPRNLYYFAQRNQSLLPDPIFVPVQGASTVSTLVNDLSHNPPGGAAMTSFPAGAHLAGVQVFPGPSGGRTAIVNIAVPRGVSGSTIHGMAIQLVCTLTSPVFRGPLFHAVRIKINGRPWDARGPALTFRPSQNHIPQFHPGMNVYYLTPSGGVRTLGPKPADRSTALRSAGIGPPALTQVAVSPGGNQMAGIGEPSGAVYTGTLMPSARPGAPPVARPLRARLQGSFTALSYDGFGDLWIAGRVGKMTGIWVLLHGRGRPQPVRIPSSVRGTVTGLRMAPDGVRVAMIISNAANAQVWLAATKVNLVSGALSITRPIPLGGQGVTGVLTGVSALTWYDEDHLLAIAGPPAATRLWEVPVDGEPPSSVLLPGGFTSVTAAGPGNPFYLGFADGKLERAFGLHQFLQPITAGHAPAYPG